MLMLRSCSQWTIDDGVEHKLSKILIDFWTSSSERLLQQQLHLRDRASLEYGRHAPCVKGAP